MKMYSHFSAKDIFFKDVFPTFQVVAQIRHKKELKRDLEQVKDWINQTFPLKKVASIREKWNQIIMQSSEENLQRMFDHLCGLGYIEEV